MHASTFHSCLCLTLSGNETDRLALLEIKARITGDPVAALTSWNDSVHFCQWHGVTCGLRHQRVTRLDLQSLQLSGSISPHVGNLSFLGVLYLLNNSFSHEIPPEIGRLRRLQDLQLQNNSISGEISSNLSSCCQLVTIRLGYNFLVESIPEELGTLSKLQTLVVRHNNLTGTLPYSFRNSSSIDKLYASSNNLKGSIPDVFGQLTNLSFLALEDNSLSGIIPPSIYNLSFLTVFSVIMNQIQGTLPSNLGSIPNGIGNLVNLQGLVLSANHFSGQIPSEVGKLQKFHSKGNRKFDNLEYLDVSGNMLSGEIPASLGSCIKVEHLNMRGNFFEGTILSSLGSLRGLKEIYISKNNLSGLIPEFLEHFEFLQTLDLSYNNLEGMVPVKEVFENATATSLKGNNKLCGGIPEFQLPKCEFGHPKKRGLSLTLKVIICLVCGLLGVSCALSFWYLLCSRRKTVVHTASDSENFLKVSYQSLLKATDGFSAANLLGMGSFGSVYKGVLEQGQTTVAVKVLNLVHRGASKSFFAECEALKNIRHLSETIERPRSLSFSQRLTIAIDVSLALDYLHHHSGTLIVHCDIKPSNVLLNDDMVAHVSDFGLVRFLPRTEYGTGHEVWTQGDVYSYGILLLEMFTGKRPTDDMFEGTSNLHNFVKAALAENVIEIVDPVLVEEKPEGEIIEDTFLFEDSIRPHIKIEESLTSILEIGVACSAELPIERPDISDVVCELYRIRNKLGLSK
ncbi:hypothetical protein ACLB2K_068889 [Fragaria x ananassa]